MKKRIEVPLWVAVASVCLHVLLGVGIVVGLLMPMAKTAVIPTMTASPTATATATVLPTKTPSPTESPTRPPTATPIPCGQDEVPGVDCSIDVGGLAVRVVSQERAMVVYDSSGREQAPKEGHEWLIIHLDLPAWTVKADLALWFEDGGMHAPTIRDAAGTIYNAQGAWGNNNEDAYVLELIFEVPKDAEELTLIIQDGDEVGLSQVPDITVTTTETPAPSSSGTEVTPFATSSVTPANEQK